MLTPRRCALVALALLPLPLACSDGNSAESELGPPALLIEGIENASGDAFEEGEQVVATCDGRLTVLTGPSESPGFLDDFTLRPPGACGSLAQCGTIKLTIYEDDKRLYEVARASLALVFDLPAAELEAATSLRVELIDGRTGTPFLVDEEPVVDEWAVDIRSTSDCPIEGGMGGGGGLGGDAALGGSSTLGGAAAGGFGGRG